MTYSPTVQKTISLLETLVGFDTTSRESNLGLIEYVRDHLQSLGLSVRLSYDADKRKANLFATFGDPKARGIVLCGHTDVVPVDGQAWNTNPFKAHIADGKIYGRGAVDMKGYIAASMAMLPAFMNSDLKQPLHIGLTYDEEVGCIGVQTLIKDLAEAGIHPAGCFVGEPTRMQVMTGHKGMRVTRCRVRGLEAHSSMAPDAVSAIEYAARLVEKIRGMALQIQKEGPFDPMFKTPHGTMQTGVIHGGTAPNIVAKDCEFIFDCRTLPQGNSDELIRQVQEYAETLKVEMRKISAEADITFETISNSAPLATDKEAAITYLGTSLARNNMLGRVSFATDAGWLNRAGIPCVVIGPGDIDVAHKPNEYIEISQLEECLGFMDRLRERMTQEILLA
ncbi:acetylornithine deacetylase [Zwartia sp.]|jgi:acetylornithine deacetylase|uniref:acetylornithine deacetylase n=1 Tax=Zwartia sp. TaxID=2978004 RepID=UPI003BAFD616